MAGASSETVSSGPPTLEQETSTHKPRMCNTIPSPLFLALRAGADLSWSLFGRGFLWGAEYSGNAGDGNYFASFCCGRWQLRAFLCVISSLRGSGTVCQDV